MKEPGNDDEDDNNDRALTISDVTKFYLRTDPLNPSIIPTLPHNLILSHEPRWHLAILLNEVAWNDEDFFVQSVRDQDYLLEPPQNPDGQPDVPDTNLTEIPPFSWVEKKVIHYARLKSVYPEANVHITLPTPI